MDQNCLKESSHFVLRDDVSFFDGHNISWPHMTPLRSPTYALIRMLYTQVRKQPDRKFIPENDN